MIGDRHIISVSGPGQCGKDHVAKIISKLTGLRYVNSTSWAAADLIFQHVQAGGWLKHGIGKFQYANTQACYDDRRNRRDLWAKFIAEINSSHPDNIDLYVKCLEYQDILTGIRWDNEFTACRAYLIDISIWIDRKGVPEDKTMQYTSKDCDFVITNPLDYSDESNERNTYHHFFCNQLLENRIEELLTHVGGYLKS